MLKESKPQSKSSTPSLYQPFRTPPNRIDNQAPRYRSRSQSNHYRRFSRESRYKSRPLSRSNFRPRYYHNHFSQNHSQFNDRTRFRYDQLYKHSSRSYYSSRPYNNSITSCSPNEPILVLSNAPLAITSPLLDAINHHTALHLNHVPIAIEGELALTKE